MAYTDLSYRLARYKASHNSYASASDFHQMLSWSPAQPWQGGCRSVECDIWNHTDGTGGRSLGYFTVSHDHPDCGPPLASYLGYLLAYHVNHPAHDPITVILDIKSSNGPYAPINAEIDTYLSEWFEHSIIYKPSDLSPNLSLSLLEASVQGRWPTIGQLAGKFIFCLSGNTTFKTQYADQLTPSSLCFSDYDIDDNTTLAQIPAIPANRIFLSYNVFSDHYDVWRNTTETYAKLGYIQRGYVIDGEGLWDKAMASGLAGLSTDEILGASWARVGSDPFVGF